MKRFLAFVLSGIIVASMSLTALASDTVTIGGKEMTAAEANQFSEEVGKATTEEELKAVCEKYGVDLSKAKKTTSESSGSSNSSTETKNTDSTNNTNNTKTSNESEPAENPESVSATTVDNTAVAEGEATDSATSEESTKAEAEESEVAESDKNLLISENPTTEANEAYSDSVSEETQAVDNSEDTEKNYAPMIVMTIIIFLLLGAIAFFILGAKVKGD